MPTEHDGSTAFMFDAVLNSEIGVSYATLRNHALTVTHGDVTRARRNNGQNDSWEITVRPSGNDAVTITLPATAIAEQRERSAARRSTGYRLSNSPSATVADPPGVSTVPVTASFANMPAEHDGSQFTFSLLSREELNETELRSTARCCGHRRHRQANSVRV